VATSPAIGVRLHQQTLAHSALDLFINAFDPNTLTRWLRYSPTVASIPPVQTDSQRIQALRVGEECIGGKNRREMGAHIYGKRKSHKKEYED
jgi:hypothetical protein